jgi:undecaprenyl-diphosphatase
MFWIIILILGIVEGLTEFIPVSSTGHLIVVDQFLRFNEWLGAGGEEKRQLFDIVIQLGAILAVGWIYREKLTGAVTNGLRQEGPDRRLLLMLIVAFLPAGVFGLLFNKFIKAHLFSSWTVALALIVGGFLILVIERLPLRPQTDATEKMTLGQAFAVGCAQVLALFPGTSRSAATIMGGLCFGITRPAATEFSCLLSFPTMMAATFYSLWKSRHALDSSFVLALSVGFLIAFIVAFAVVKWLIRYVQSHDFTLFAIYRILFGAFILYLVYTGKMKG